MFTDTDTRNQVSVFRFQTINYFAGFFRASICLVVKRPEKPKNETGITPDSVVTSDRKREAQSLRSKVDGFLSRSRRRSAVLGRMLTSWQRRARAQNDFATSQSDAFAAPGFRLALGKFGLTAESEISAISEGSF